MRRTLLAALVVAAAAAWLCRPAQALVPPAMTPADRMGLRWRLLVMSSGAG